MCLFLTVFSSYIDTSYRRLSTERISVSVFGCLLFSNFLLFLPFPFPFPADHVLHKIKIDGLYLFCTFSFLPVNSLHRSTSEDL